MLPFDLTRAHALYKSLFGGAEDVIKGKSLLVVPSVLPALSSLKALRRHARAYR